MNAVEWHLLAYVGIWWVMLSFCAIVGSFLSRQYFTWRSRRRARKLWPSLCSDAYKFTDHPIEYVHKIEPPLLCQGCDGPLCEC